MLLLKIFGIALLVRGAAYLVLNFWLFGGDFQHPDSLYYHRAAEELASSWRSGSLHWVSYPAYSNLVAALYFVFGPHRLVAELVSLVAGSALAVVVYSISARLFSSRAAVLSCVLAIISPSLIYWSTQLLRDSLIALVVACLLYACISRQHWSLVAIQVVAGLSCLTWLLNREPLSFGLALALVAGIGLSFLLFRKRNQFRYGALCGAVVFLAIHLVALSVGGTTVRQAAESRVASPLEAANRLSAGTAVSPPVNTPFFVALNEPLLQENEPLLQHTDYLDLALFLPRSLARSFVLPYPWAAQSLYERMFAANMILWYLMVSVGLFGILRTTWNQNHVTIIVAGAILAIGLGMVATNMSTLIRHRLPIEALVIIWAGQGLDIITNLRGRARHKASATLVRDAQQQ